MYRKVGTAAAAFVLLVGSITASFAETGGSLSAEKTELGAPLNRKGLATPVQPTIRTRRIPPPEWKIEAERKWGVIRQPTIQVARRIDRIGFRAVTGEGATPSPDLPRPVAAMCVEPDAPPQPVLLHHLQHLFQTRAWCGRWLS